MATITASSVATTDSLETFRQRFNTLRSDIQGLSFGASIVFEGATADDYETTLAITDPTADRTVTIQNKTGVLAMQGRDINDIVVLDASDGSGTDEAGAILLNASASGVDEGEALLYEDGTGDHIVNPVLQIGGNFVFEGATANEFETTLSITDPTADRTVTIQDKTGTVALLGRDIDDIIVLNGTDASGTDESSSIILDGDATSVAGVVVNVGEALLYEEGTSDHLLNPVDATPEFILMEDSVEGRPVNLVTEVSSEKFIYQPATGDNLLGSLFLPPAAGGIQFIMPVADGNANQVFSTDGAGNLQFVNQSDGLSLNNDGNNRVITATGSNTGNGEENLTFDGSTLVITGAIDMSGAFDTDGVASAATFEPDGDTSAGDAAAIGYTAVLGLILTGQGSTNDVTIVNDADATVLSVATGGTDVDIVGDVTAATLNADGDTSAGDNAAIGYTSAEGLILTGQGSTSDITLKNDADTTVFSVPTGSDDILFPDGAKILLGTGSDLQIYHDGSNGYIVNNAGNLIIDDQGGGGITLKYGTETMANFAPDGAVELYYDNSKKLETTSTGIQITSTTYAPISRRGEDVFIVLDQTAAAGTDAGDNVIMNASDGSSTDDGDDIIGEDEVFLHSGMQRNVLNIFNSGGRLLNSVAGFAPGAI